MANHSLTLPYLTMAKEIASQRLRERIDLAKEVLPRLPRSNSELAEAVEREKKWRAFNVELLSRMFTNNEYATEYSKSMVHIRQSEDRYIDPSMNALISRLHESVKRQVTQLESVIERLELIDEATTKPTGSSENRPINGKVFVVHGHDHGARDSVARFLDKLGLEAIILEEQPDRGYTIIEKFQGYASQVSFAVVLLTPDDLGGMASSSELAPRARQNVLFELGYFVGRLGRGRVCLLQKGAVEIPSDMYGVIYSKFDSGEGWKLKLLRELKAAGLTLDRSAL